ncbi:MAG: ABC transporter permease, partial [Gemmatimonadota bacterium]
MRISSELRERFRALVWRSREEREMEEELRHHVEMEAERLAREEDLDPVEARRRALLKLGGVEQTKERVREARGTRRLEELAADVRYALRTFGRSPGFAATAVAAIALGIGATTALFSGVNGLLLRPLPFQEPERLVQLSASRSLAPGPISYPEYEAVRESTRTLGDVALDGGGRSVVLEAGGAPEEVRTRFVSGNYFGLLGVRPARGRLLRPEDDVRGGATEGVVLSHGFWRSRFGGEASVVGRAVRLNGRPVVVLGVLEEAFGDATLSPPAEVFAPLALEPVVVPGADPYDAMSFGLRPVGRLRDGVSREAAASELAALAERIEDRVPVPEMVAITGISADPLQRVPEGERTPLFRTLGLLALGTVLVLLIASVNVGGMLVARAAGREREMAIRSSLGAGRGRLVRQLLTEGVLLFVAGGAAGVALAMALVGLIDRFRWPDPVSVDLSVDHRVLGFALAVSVASGLAFSLLPALRAARPSLMPSLKEGGAGGGAGRRGVRLRRLPVIGQLALSVVLLVGAGLFVRTLRTAFTYDAGFEPERVWAAAIDAGRQRYGEAEARTLYDRVLERVRALPGVDAATLATGVPAGPGSSDVLHVRPADESGAAELEVRAHVVDEAFFRTLRIPILRGRPPASAAAGAEQAPAVVSETLARELWPGGDAMGKRLRQTFSGQLMVAGRTDEMEATHEVVGVVPDGRYRSLREPGTPFAFLALDANHRSRVALAVRVADGADEG